jgi:ligand-binding sensor domain-containing protein/signal transduction histidine kinase
MIAGTDTQFRRLPSDSGLSQTRVSEIVQDDDGFIWFGTQNGLNRFDGHKCKVFRHDPQRPDSLSGVYIHALFKDRSGFIWVASDQFLDRFDPVTETFTHYPLRGPERNDLTTTVTHISQDSSGYLWLSTNKGLFRLDPATRQSNRFVNDPRDSATIGDDDVKSTGEDHQGRFWVSTSQSLDEFDRGTGKAVRHIATPNSGVGTRFHEDRFGVFWIFYGDDGLPGMLDRESGLMTRFQFNPDPLQNRMRNRVYTMLEDHNGNMWFGSAYNGVLEFDREHRRFVSYSNRLGDNDSLADNRVSTLFEDREGTIWIGLHQAEPNFFTTRRPFFEKFTHESGNPNSLEAPLVSALYEDRDGLLWVGTDHGVTSINRKMGQYSSFKPIARTGSTVLSIVEQGPNILWFGTGNGVKRYDRNTGELKEFLYPLSPTFACNQSIVERLLLDNDGTLWGATWEGLCRFDRATQSFTTFKPEGNGRGLNYHAIALDKGGKLWLGSEIGLHRFDPLTSRFTIYSHRPDDAHSLSDNRVNSVYFDHAGTLWAGTQDGLDKFDPRTNSFSVYGEQQGMSGNVVSCVLEDGKGSLWMSTNKGISNFDPRTASFKNYTVADGLPGDDLTGWGACFKSSTGEMFFGGFSGATAFFPDQMADDTSVPPIVLTDFRLFGNSVLLGKNSPLARSIGHTHEVTLSHTQNVFAIEFSALSYLNAETNRYRYKLEGLDAKWNEVDSNQRVAAYTTLPYGTYTFCVEAATSHGHWNEPGATLRIQILPAWWQTLWFRLLSLSGAFAILLLLYLLRLNQVAASIRGRMQERLGERERIARELHDTLLQGIQGLILRFQAAAVRIPNSEPARQLMDSALDRADEVMAEGRDRVRHLRVSVGPTKDLAEAFTEAGQELSRGTNVEFAVVVEGDVRPLHPLVLDEAYWIGHEALVNAFQHAEGTRIEVEIAYDQNQWRIRVRDNGRGIDPQVLESGGKPDHWGMSGMRERATKIGGQMQIWSRPEAGTEVELSVPASKAYRPNRSRSAWTLLLRAVRGGNR